MNERVFTQQELEDLAMLPLDKLKNAIIAGETEKALSLADELYNGFTFLHDGYFCWISGLLTHIYNKYGVEAVEEAEREAHTLEGKIAFPPLGEMSFKEVVQHTAKALHGHVHQPMTIEEDDKKVIITVDPCGSGGRLIEKGAYEAGFAKIKEPCNLTWGMADFPIYCVHCPIGEMLEIENTGNFRFAHGIHEISEVGPSCRYLLYKEPENIPEEYYARIGKTKRQPSGATLADESKSPARPI